MPLSIIPICSVCAAPQEIAIDNNLPIGYNDYATNFYLCYERFYLIASASLGMLIAEKICGEC